MDLIARRPAAPAIHSYVAFDPLREVYFRHGRDRISPLQLARDALANHGFVGVKLYPPMGFKPLGNSNAWPDYFRFIERDLGYATRLGDELDAALQNLYGLCVEIEAPVLAHAADSNGAGPHFADRADPAFWFPVFEKYPTESMPRPFRPLYLPLEGGPAECDRAEPSLARGELGVGVWNLHQRASRRAGFCRPLFLFGHPC